MILASISGGQSLGKPLPELSRQGQSLFEGPFSVSCRKSKPFKPSDAVGFDEKSRLFDNIVDTYIIKQRRRLASYLGRSLVSDFYDSSLILLLMRGEDKETMESFAFFLAS